MISFIIAASSPEDQAFMLQVYTDYERLLFAAAGKYCPNPVDCSDVVQESLVKLIAKCDLLSTLEPQALAGYIVTTVRNTAYSLFRQRAAEQKHFPRWEHDADELPADDRYSPEDHLLRQERLDALRSVWSQLSTETQVLLEGRYILHCTDQELAEQLGCSTGSIRMRLTRARRHLMDLLLQEEDSDE